MNEFIFVYTIAIISICCSASVFSLSTYAITKRKTCFVQIVFFLTYIYEISDIFFYEWSQQNLIYSGKYYEISNPVIRIITGATILFCLWLMLMYIIDVHSKKLLFIPTLVFIILCMIVVWGLPYGAIRQWCFYTLRQVYISWCLIYSKYHFEKSKNSAYRERLSRYSKQYKILWVFTAMIVAEDVFIILLHPEPSAMQNQLPLYLSERNFSENGLMIFVAYYTCKEAFDALSLRYKEPPTTSKNKQEDLQRHIQNQLPSYANKYNITSREQEVLSLLLLGNTNRKIAHQLFLSEGTIKTHVHNIMKKTKCKSRKQLKMHFWEN